MRPYMISEAIDHFEDAAKFLKCARIEAEKGKEAEVMQFLELASESAGKGEYAIQHDIVALQPEAGKEGA